MKHLFKFLAACCLALIVCAAGAAALLYYTRPMEDASYNLSLSIEDGQEWEGEKGWSVYTNENGRITPLRPDGIGGYTGLDTPGQTLYFSRRMDERLDSPTLRIGAANRSVSVFLDGSLLYTDDPEAGSQIGALRLPMLEYDRLDPVVVSLPLDYVGKELTIAQSTPVISEKQGDNETVYPCEVTLYCGYSYESGLIAEAAQALIPAALLFALAVSLLAAFVWRAFYGGIHFAFCALALTALFQMCGVLSQAPFFFQYFGTLPIDPGPSFFLLSVGSLLLFLACSAKRLRLPLAGVLALHVLALAVSFLNQAGFLADYGDLYLTLSSLPRYTALAGLLLALAAAGFEAAGGDPFFRRMGLAALTLFLLYLLFLLACIPAAPAYPRSVLDRLVTDFSVEPKFSLHLLWLLCLPSCVLAFAAELLEHETQRRTELAVLSEKNRLALESYENLRRQSETLHMLRHDVAKHYSMLAALAAQSPERLSEYLADLGEPLKELAPVVQTQNPVLDILLNGKLNDAAAHGLPVELVRAEAPSSLPLSDSDLCSLVLNILDNAFAAAERSEAPYIRLDLHCKNNYFILVCENSVPAAEGASAAEAAETREQKNGAKKAPAQTHGYGLKIIRHIVKKSGGILSVEPGTNAFRITAALPLS